MRKHKTTKEFAETNFLSERKRMLNEISNENVIYEESQTGPQEEPTLKEIHIRTDYINKNKKKKGNCKNS